MMTSISNVPQLVRSCCRSLPIALRVLMACVLMQACKADEPPLRGQLMVVLQTDMSLPKDVTQVKIQIKVDGKLYHDKNYVIARGEDWITKLPGTLAVVASVDEPTPPVEVVVVGLRGSEARVFAKSVTTIPERRTATLFVPIQWLCDGQVKELPAGAGFESDCSPASGKERACRAGSCVSVEVEESSLKDFEEEDVFGGAAEGSDAGQCFNTQGCFQAGFTVQPNEDCIVELEVPEGFGLNFGLLNPDNEDGICYDNGPREGDCIVPLDRHNLFGWDYVKGTKATSKPVRAQLPKAVCRQLESEKFDSVTASFSCAAKTLKYPACGPWTDLKVVGDVNEVSPQPTSSSSAPPDAGPEADAAPQLESLTIQLPNDDAIEIGIPITLELLATETEGSEPVDVATLADWSSEDEDVATVDAGVVTGHSTGTTTVTANFGGLTATFEVTVERGTPQDLAFSNAPSAPIAAGLPHTLVANALYAGDEQEDVSELAAWSSSDETIATVVGGVVTTLAPGEVTITATFEGVETDIELQVGEAIITDFKFGQQKVATNEFQVVVTAVLSDASEVEVTDDVAWEQLSGEEFGTLDTDTGIVSVENQGVVEILITYEGDLPYSGNPRTLRINVTFEGADE
jgi:hypothetical protein